MWISIFRELEILNGGLRAKSLFQPDCRVDQSLVRYDPVTWQSFALLKQRSKRSTTFSQEQEKVLEWRDVRLDQGQRHTADLSLRLGARTGSYHENGPND